MWVWKCDVNIADEDDIMAGLRHVVALSPRNVFADHGNPIPYGDVDRYI
jgi:hypothetical protein